MIQMIITRQPRLSNQFVRFNTLPSESNVAFPIVPLLKPMTIFPNVDLRGDSGLIKPYEMQLMSADGEVLYGQELLQDIITLFGDEQLFNNIEDYISAGECFRFGLHRDGEWEQKWLSTNDRLTETGIAGEQVYLNFGDRVFGWSNFQHGHYRMKLSNLRIGYTMADGRPYDAYSTIVITVDGNIVYQHDWGQTGNLECEFDITEPIAEVGIVAYFTYPELAASAFCECTEVLVEREDPGFDYVSNLLKLTSSTEGLSYLEYWCDENQFGLDFTRQHACGFVPFMIHNPKYITKDEVYEKLSGESVVLFSTICKEYDLVTEYMPETWHDALIVALSCDHLMIDDVPMIKSGEYSLDWDKTTEEGDEELVMGTGKVKENFNSRNSN